MSDTVTQEKLALVPTIKEGIAIATKNLVPILVNVLLWILTAWIPYLNVGTTIGLMVGIVSKASKGQAIPMTEIFDPKYRKYMGEFFLCMGLISVGVGVGTAFVVIPGIVIALAWSQAILLVIDKGKNPTEAITLSNNCTYGYKWKMAGIFFLTGAAFCVLQMILMTIGTSLGSIVILYLIMIIILAVTVLEIFVFIGLQASVYKQLTKGI